MVDDVVELDDFPFRELTKADRCDRLNCNAEARFLAVKDEMELTFCGHHGQKLEVALLSQGFVVHNTVWDIDE